MGNPLRSEISISEQKDLLRADFKARLSLLGKDQLVQGSEEIAVKLESLFAQNKNWQNIAVFYPLASEPNLLSVYKKILKENKSLFFPKIREAGEMDFYKVSDELELTSFQKAKLNIMEPKSELKVQPSSLHCLIIPGLAFDENANRLGRGAGYYDRYLANTKGAKIGVAF
ncbi:MAG: 5-formyltetrahydrofolate cyclo-ligase, partial [Bdellovibrionota bacterium]|nr:5-formyltetrahydrofolate cyclo-ligase [Bdellovibrionota bacterium]